MRIVVADDEQLGRYSLCSMLSEMPRSIASIREAEDGESLVQAVDEHAPELVFVDIRMPRLNGLQAMAQLVDDHPGTIWVVVSAHDEFSYAQEAIRLGVFRYLLKPVDPAELLDVVDAAIALLEERRRSATVNGPDLAAARLLTTRILPVNRDQLGAAVRRMLDWTEHHYRENVGLSQAAAGLSLSVGYLSGRFHEETGLTFSRYITALRMHAANMLLGEPSAMVNEVAAAVGYSNRRHFSRSFSEYWGRPPSAVKDAGEALDMKTRPRT